MVHSSNFVFCSPFLLLLLLFVKSGTSFQLAVKSRTINTPNNGYSIGSSSISSSISKQNSSINDDKSNTKLSAMPFFQWFQRKEDPSEGDLNELTIRELNNNSSKNNNQRGIDTMQRTAKMMQNHRRSQEASERTMAIMEELSSTLVVGKSKAGVGAMGGIAGIAGVASGDQRKGGVQVTFDGQRRPVSVAVDPNFLFSTSSSGESEGVVSIEELDAAITDAMLHGYELSGKVMEEKMAGLYEQLGLPREPPSLSSK